MVGMQSLYVEGTSEAVVDEHYLALPSLQVQISVRQAKVPTNMGVAVAAINLLVYQFKILLPLLLFTDFLK